jgi:hypothetical protein
MRTRLLLSLLALVLVGVGAGIVITSGSGEGDGERAAACRESREAKTGEAEGEAAVERERAARAGDANPLYSGPAEREGGCEKPGKPEGFAELARANSALATRSLAPGTSLKPGAFRSAVRAADELPVAGNSWTPYGDTPLQGNLTDYDTTDGSTRQGLPGLSGRTTSLVAGAGGAIYAGASNGGVWRSADQAKTWSHVSLPLPTQVVGSIAWTAAGGGTLLALTGDDAFGGNSNPGLGVYYTRDGGATWRHSSGVPDGVLGFKLAVDPVDPATVYAGTGAGLFRSTDGGETFANVKLPTGAGATPDCSGQPPTVKGCFLANMVTDVVVQAAGGPAKTKGGAVMAAVGWRAGTKPNADGSIQSPNNGIYVSDTGAPGSFKNADMAGNSVPVPPFGTDPLTQARIGRVELGIANGAAQDHKIVYAIVQDAVKFNGGVVGLDANENGLTSAAQSDVLNGIWVSPDFGATWRQLEGASALGADTTSGSALAPPTCKTPAVIAYCPGVQAWYNEWVQPDPTQQTAAGVPTRVLFGLEEVWANRGELTPPTGFDGTTSTQFEVIGRYYADEACTLLPALNSALPVCPTTVATTNGMTTKTTTHPDQHSALFVPDADGKGSTLYVGNDGGVFAQHAGTGESYEQGKWGNGSNVGLRTLQPYDAAMAKDGTVYMGLQDNGEGKIEPSGKSYTVFGGDGGFTAVDPDNSDIAYEEYTYGVMAKTADGGKTWSSIDPAVTSGQFITPFEMDDADAKHLLVGGRDIKETIDGGTWTTAYDLGTQQHPGDAAAASSETDPNNQASALDVVGQPPVKTAGTGPPTKDFEATGGPFAPNPSVSLGGPYVPGTYGEHPFTIGANDGNAKLKIDVSWDDPAEAQDWDAYLFRKDDKGEFQQVAEAATSANPETITLPTPDAGDYVLRVVNFAAAVPYTVKGTFTGGAASTVGGAAYPSSAYVGFCGFCDVITQGVPFASGIATNVGGDKPGKTSAGDGWHIAAAKGLPTRYITSVRMDPANPRTVFVTLGGYGRRWAQPGALADDTSKVGKGHVFRSDDAGETFRDISANLPDAPANWSLVHKGNLVVASDFGVFVSCDSDGGSFSRLGSALPRSPVFTLRYKPGDPDTIVAASFGSGVWTYRFANEDLRCGGPGSSVGASGGTSCLAATAARRFKATPVRGKRRVRFTLPKAGKRASRIDIFQVSTGRRIYRERLIGRFRNRTGRLNWNGRSNQRGRHTTNGYYFARVTRPGSKVVSRLVLQRSKGRWHRRPDFYLRGTCGVLNFAKFERPVFGGTRRFPLRFSYQVGKASVVRAQLWKGKKLIKSFPARKAAGGRTYRLHRGLKGLKKGPYQVTLRVTRGKQRVVATLVSRRI